MNPTPPEPPQSTASDVRPAAADALHSAVWFGIATLFNILAAVAAFGHASRPALCWGAMAMAATLAATLFRRRHKRVAECDMTETLPCWVTVPPAVVSVWAVSLACAMFAAAAYWSTRGWRGFETWGGLLVGREGVIGLAIILAALFLVFGAWLAFRPLPLRATAIRAVLLGLAAILLGPGIVLEQRSSFVDMPPTLFIKRSPAEAWAAPWNESVVLGRTVVQGDDGQAKSQTCVLLERYARLLVAWQRPPGGQDSAADEAVRAARREEACGERAQRALDSGAAAEALLLRGDLDAYFARVRHDDELRHRAIALEPGRLPPPLGKPLLDLLTVHAREDYTPFDLALATRRQADAEATLPDPDKLRLHQRQGLFELGMAQRAGTAMQPADAAGQALAEQGERRMRQLMLAGAMEGTDNLGLRMAIQGLILQQGGREAASGVGPFSPVDYVMANRRCDLRYAEFLHQQGLVPEAAHAAHLLSLIGRAQYPGISSEFQQAFPAADDSLGLPDADRLRHCVDLARFYSRQVKDWSAGASVPEESPLRQVYQAAADAVFQWFLRDAEASRKAHGIPPRVHDVTVIGAPEIAVEAAHAIVAALPPSPDQYCHWANTWHSWMWLTKERRPELTRVMREMAQGWRQGTPDSRAPWVLCGLSLPWKTNEYEDVQEGMQLLNADLRRLGLPCRAVREVAEGYTQQLKCRGVVSAAERPEPAARGEPAR